MLWKYVMIVEWMTTWKVPTTRQVNKSRQDSANLMKA